MPNVNSKINFMVGTSASFNNLQTKDTDTLYFLTDTHQIFVGADEYTKSVRFLNAVPTSSTEGVEGIVYVYSAGNTLYTCSKNGNAYDWTVIATLTNCTGSVTGDAVTFVKDVSISGQTLTGTTQAADVTITSNSSSIPTSRAVKNYADTTLGYTITTRLTNTTSGGLEQNVEFMPSMECNLTSTWDSLWNVDHTQTGTGTVIWTLNGTEISRQTNVAQGALSFNIMPYLTPSATHIAVQKIIDYEQNERTLTYTIITTAEIPVHQVDFYVNSVLEQTSYVKDGGSVKWLGGAISVPNKYFDGWDKPLTNITDDTVITAKLSELALPAAPVDVSQYDYVWTNNPSYTSAYTWGELLAICNSNDYLNYISIGDIMRVELGDNASSDLTFRFRFVGYNHYKIAGTNQFAHTCWSIADATDTAAQMNSSNTNVGGFPTSRMRTVTFPLLYSVLPDTITASIPTLEYPRLNGNSLETTTMVEYPLYNETAADLGLYTVAPYSNEVSSGADSIAFPYYVSNATRIKKLGLGTGLAVNYWTGTPVHQSSANFWIVYTSGAGDHNSYASNSSLSVGFGFCLGRD